MNQTTSEKTKILNDQQAFYFHTSINNYTGLKARSLKEFQQELCKVDQKSLEFHLFREDFEKWIRLSLKEETLAKKVEALRKQNIKGRLLRNWLYTHVKHHNQPTEKSIKVSRTSKVTKQKVNPRKSTSAYSS